jgi:hypothetical protein
MKINFKFNVWGDSFWEFFSKDFCGWVHLNHHTLFKSSHNGIIRFRERYFRRFS